MLSGILPEEVQLSHLSAALNSDGFSLPGYVLQRQSFMSVSTSFLNNFGYVQCNTYSIGQNWIQHSGVASPVLPSAHMSSISVRGS